MFCLRNKKRIVFSATASVSSRLSRLCCGTWWVFRKCHHIGIMWKVLTGMSSVRPAWPYTTGTLPVHHWWPVFSFCIFWFLLFHFIKYFFELNNDGNDIKSYITILKYNYNSQHLLFPGHRTGKGQFSFQSQRKAMPKKAQTTTQLHSSHTLE